MTHSPHYQISTRSGPGNSMSWAGTAPTGSYCPLAFAVSAPHGRALRQPLTCAGEKKACPRPAHDSSQSRIDMDAKRLVAHGRDRQHTCASCSVAAAHAAARHVARTGWTGCQGHRPCRRCHGCRRQHRQRARGPGRRHGLVGWGTLAAAAPSLPCCRPRLRPRRLRARPPPPPPPPRLTARQPPSLLCSRAAAAVLRLPLRSPLLHLPALRLLLRPVPLIQPRA